MTLPGGFVRRLPWDRGWEWDGGVVERAGSNGQMHGCNRCTERAFEMADFGQLTASFVAHSQESYEMASGGERCGQESRFGELGRVAPRWIHVGRPLM
jgi:hypothetical protein